MAHRAGRRTCRAPRPGPRLVSRDLSASASSCSSSQGRGPQRPAGADGRGPRSLRCQPCPAAERCARLLTLSAARGGRAGRDAARRLPPPSASPWAFISSAPALPACPPPRLPDGPALPGTHSAAPRGPRPALALTVRGGQWGSETPARRTSLEDPPQPCQHWRVRSESRGCGRGQLPPWPSLPGALRKGVPAPGFSDSTHSQVRPRWQEQLKPCSPSPQRPLETVEWLGGPARRAAAGLGLGGRPPEVQRGLGAASTGASACHHHHHHHGPCRKKEMRTALGSIGQGLNPGCTGTSLGHPSLAFSTLSWAGKGEKKWSHPVCEAEPTEGAGLRTQGHLRKPVLPDQLQHRPRPSHSSSQKLSVDFHEI